MPRRHPRLPLSAGLIASALLVGLPAAAQAHQGREVALSASKSSVMRVGANYPMLPTADPIYGRDAVGLAVNPRNPKHIVALYNDNKTLWCEVGVSFDGGRKWRRSRLKAPTGFISPPCTVGNHLANFIDGSIAFGKGDTVYTTFASGILDAQGDSQGKSVLVARSNNGGRSFGVAAVALPGGVDVDAGPDYTLPKLAVQPGSGRGTDSIYLVANESRRAAGQPAQNSTVVTSSADGGATWAAPVAASPAGRSAIEATQPVLGKGGALYVGWRTQNPGARPGSFLPEGTVVVARSTDRGRTWTSSTAAGVRGFVYTGPPIALYANTKAFTGSTFPRLAADRRSGNVYLVYGNGEVPIAGRSVVAADHFIHRDMDVYFQRSTDGGTTWSDPARLNRNAPIQLEITQTRHPNISVAPNGRLDVVWQDRRHWYFGPSKADGTGICTHTHTACDEARLGDTYYRSSSNGGATFSAERRITDRSMNNDVGYDYRFGTYWDYGPVSVPLGNDKVLFAWMDSRDGNVETDDMGIYLARANLKGSRAIPVRPVRARSASDLAIALSRRTYPGGPEAVLAATFATRPFSRVVIASERDLGGVLAGGVLGRSVLGPVLLSSRDGLSSSVKGEVARLAPVGAYVIGGPGSLSDQVLADLASTGIPQDQIIRLAGPSDAATAALIATTMDRRSAAQKAAGLRAFEAAAIVNPASPDAAAISVLAANRRFPVLFAGPGALPPETAEALRTLNINRTIVVGGTRWVGAAAAAALPRPQRIAGSTPVATSRALLAQSRRWGLPTNVVFAADQGNRMGAALLGATAGRSGGVLLLSPGGPARAAKVLDQLKLRSTVDHLVMAELPRAATGR